MMENGATNRRSLVHSRNTTSCGRAHPQPLHLVVEVVIHRLSPLLWTRARRGREMEGPTRRSDRFPTVLAVYADYTLCEGAERRSVGVCPSAPPSTIWPTTAAGSTATGLPPRWSTETLGTNRTRGTTDTLTMLPVGTSGVWPTQPRTESDHVPAH